MIESYRAEVPRCEPTTAARLLHEIARLYEVALDDPASALAAIEEALNMDPGAPGALSAGVRLLLACGQPRRAAALLQRGTEAVRDVGSRISALLDLAVLQELRLGDAERALETYELIRALEPTNLPALEALLRLHLGRGDWAQVRELCGELALAEKDVPTRCSLLLVAALLSPDAEERKRRLDLCLDTGELHELALALALPGLEAEGWQRALESLDQGSGPRSAVLQHQMSWILAEHLSRPGDAVSHARRAVELAPDEVGLWDRLAELLRREARWEELVGALQRLAELAGPTTAAIDLHLTAALLLDTRLHDQDRAISALTTLLELEPDNALAWPMLEAIHVRGGRWEDAVQLQLRRAESCQAPGEQSEALFRAAELEVRQSRPADAARLLERAVSISNHQPGLRLLERLYRQQERWADLAELLRREADRVESPSRRRGLLTDVAGLLEHRLGDHEKALAVLTEVDRLPPDPLHALWSIVRIGETSGDTTAALSALRALESRTEPARERAAVVFRLGQLIDRGGGDGAGDPAAALAQLRRALEIDPTLPGLREAVLRQIVLLQRWPELVEHLEERLAEESRSGQRFALLRSLAWLLADVTGQRGQAASTWRQALAVAPESTNELALQGLLRTLGPDDLHRLPGPHELERLQGRRHAAASLFRLGQRLLDLEEREQATEAQAQVVIQRGSRLDPASELGRYLLLRSLLRQGDLEAAIDALPPLSGALLALGGLRQPGRALQLVRDHLEGPVPGDDTLAAARWCDVLAGGVGAVETETLSARASLEEDATRRRDVLYRLAASAELRAHDELDAVSIYRAILDDLPREERALRALERLGHDRQDLALRLEALEGLTLLGRPGTCFLESERASLLLRLGNGEEALALWRRALQEDPTCRPAYDALRCLYWERGDTEGLSWTLERGLDAVSHPRAVTGDLLQRAEFREQRGDVSGALADLERVLSLNPGLPEAVDREVRLLRQQGDLDLLQRRLEHAAQHTASPRRQAQLLLELATLRRDQAGDPAGAHRILSRAISVDPNNVEALVQAAELQVRLDQPTEALALLNRVVLRTDEGETWLRAHLRMAHICANLLDDLPRARASLEAVLEREPEHREALVGLVDLAERQGDLSRLERELRRLVEATEEGPQRADILARLAETVRGHEDKEALQLLQKAVELEPGDPLRLRDLVRALERAERWTELDRLLERNVEALDPGEQLPFLLMHGRVLGQLDRPAEARAVLHQVLAGDPENRAAMELLVGQVDGTRDSTQLDEAIELHRRLLQRNPLTVESIRALNRLCSQRGRADEAFCASGCLVFLDEATEEERYFHQRLRDGAPAQPTGTLTGQQITRLALPAGDHPLRPLLALLREHLPALLPADLSHFGIEPGPGGGAFETTRLAADHAAWDVASICSGVLRLGHFELAEARGGAPHGVCLPGDPPVVLLPRNFLRLPMPDQLFLCGRLLARIAVHTEALDPGRRPPIRVRDLELLQVGLLHHAVPRVNGEPTPGAIVADMAHRAEQQLPADLLERARTLAAEASSITARESWATWLRSTELGACRAGLLCAGGLDALATFWFRDGPITDDLRRELILFALSEQHAEGRTTLGLALRAREPWR